MKPGTWFTSDTIKITISLVLLTNVLSIVYFFTSESSPGDRVMEPSERLSRGERFVSSSTEDRVIHIVKDKSFDWHEHEFHTGFDECPHFRNCRVQTHYITNQSVPLSIPHKGDAVVFTVQAANLQRDPSWWTRAADKRSKDLAWVLFSQRNPYEFPLSFMTFRNYGFNFTMTYKPNSDIFTPFNFWLSEGNPSPRMVRKNFAQGKTRKVLWLIDGPCHSINNRMKYAKDLSQNIALDIIGHCYDQSGKVHQVDHSTHNNEGRRGVISDYKFVLAFEEISCRDYVTTTYFDVAQMQSVIPIVMGAQKEAYEILGPLDSFIHIDDFKGPQELANYLHELDLNDHNYNQFFRFVDTGEFQFPITTMCRLCDHINYFKESGYQQFYTKDQFEEFWTSDDCNLNSLFLGDDSSGNSVP